MQGRRLAGPHPDRYAGISRPDCAGPGSPGGLKGEGQVTDHVDTLALPRGLCAGDVGVPGSQKLLMGSCLLLLVGAEARVTWTISRASQACAWASRLSLGVGSRPGPAASGAFGRQNRLCGRFASEEE